MSVPVAYGYDLFQDLRSDEDMNITEELKELL